jgi:hypothetical protein
LPDLTPRLVFTLYFLVSWTLSFVWVWPGGIPRIVAKKRCIRSLVFIDQDRLAFDDPGDPDGEDCQRFQPMQRMKRMKRMKRGYLLGDAYHLERRQQEDTDEDHAAAYLIDRTALTLPLLEIKCELYG